MGNTGNVLNSYSYDAFGNTVTSTGTIANRFMYAGEQFDKVTGEYYLRARYYDPVVGRFTQEDTYRGDGLNLYAYVANNPVKYSDPSGHDKTGIVVIEDGLVPGSAAIISATLNPITIAARNYVDAQFNEILNEYYRNEWPSGYAIKEYTYSAYYEDQYLDAVQRAEFFMDIPKTIGNVIDLAQEIEDSYDTYTAIPSVDRTTAIVVGAIKYEFDESESGGFGDIPEALGSDGFLAKDIAKALEKKTYIEKQSPFKYLVYKSGARDKFVNSLKN